MQVLELMESSRKEEVSEGERNTFRLGDVGFDADKHLVICSMENRPQRLDWSFTPTCPWSL